MSNKYRIDTEENRTFQKEIRDNLLNFGRRFPSPGGSSYYLGDDGTPWKDRNRETWITSRMVHVYSIAAMLGFEGGKELAAAGLKGLTGELHDDVHGGWYAGRTPEGGIVPGKACYAHAFVILAATSAYLAGIDGAKTLLDEALNVFDRYFWNESEGLTCDSWNTEFTEMDSYRGINANMHTVEAFLAAADALREGPVWASGGRPGAADRKALNTASSYEKYRVRAGRMIERVTGWAEEFSWRIPEHFSDKWVPEPELNSDKKDDQFKPYGATPGHGIEWARLITQWALSSFENERAGVTGGEDISECAGRAGYAGGPECAGSAGYAGGRECAGSPECAGSEGYAGASERAGTAKHEGMLKYVNIAEKLYRRAVTDGWNADGAPGIVYTTGWDGKPVVHDRMHWTLAEAINTSGVLFHVTGKAEYAEDYAAFGRYLDEFVLDHAHGSWFHQLDRENRVIGTVWPGKSDIYHALQSTLIPYLPAHVSVAAAVKRK